MRVRDWMSPDPATVTDSTSVRDARRLLRYYGVRHLPVVDGDGGGLVGMVSDRDLRVDEALMERLDASEQFYATADIDRSVSAVMSTPVHTISADEAVEAAARLMLSRRISALPVVDDQALVGIITTTDCLLASLSPRSDEPSPPLVGQ